MQPAAFRIYPEREQQGVLGYIAHSAIEAILNGEQADLSKAVFVYGLALGEGAENGIAASKDGAVILTNQNCYLLRANNGVEAVWCTPYESVGAKVSGENDKTTGGGLAWGGGCSPTLTPNLVLFTDNQDPVNLLALDMKTGEVVASTSVLDDLPEGYQVAVENSAIVYDDGEGTVSTIVCNWFGAGAQALLIPTVDSSIQSYANIYDTNWLTKGNCMIAPGVERVDTVKTDSGYEMKSIWSRNDLSDTSILKLSTATGYIYGYVQNLESGMWQYIIWTLRPARPFSRWMFPINTVTTTWQSECTPATAATRSTARRAIWSCCACRTALCIFPKCPTVRSISTSPRETRCRRRSLNRMAAKVRSRAGAIL